MHSSVDRHLCAFHFLAIKNNAASYVYMYVHIWMYVYIPRSRIVGGSDGKKHLPTMRETWVRSLDGEDPWRRKWQPTPVLLPGKSHGRRSLTGYSPWGLKELDTTERLHFTSLHFMITQGHMITSKVRSSGCTLLEQL